MKKIRLVRSIPDETIRAIASETLCAAGLDPVSGLPHVGAVMSDGTLFAGISPDTHKPMYTTPADASLTMRFNEAQKYAAKLDAHGHKDWRVPTLAELTVLFNNRAILPGFNQTGLCPGSYYWSSSETGQGHMFVRRFSDGDPNFAKDASVSLRCVR